MIFKDLNKKFNKIFIILLIICIFNIFLYNYKRMNINNIIKETYLNTTHSQPDNELSTFKEKIILKNKKLLHKCGIKDYYETNMSLVDRC